MRAKVARRLRKQALVGMFEFKNPNRKASYRRLKKEYTRNNNKG